MEWTKFDNMLRHFRAEDDGTLIVKATQDLSSVLKYTEDKRNSEVLKPNDEFRHYATVPLVIVEHIMAKYGITSMGQELSDVLFPEIDINYPYLKVTNTNERFGNIPTIINQGNL